MVEESSYLGGIVYVEPFGKKRIVKIVPLQYRKSKIVTGFVKTYVLLGKIKTDYFETCNYYTYSMREGFKYVGGPIDKETQDGLDKKKKHLNFLEKLDNLKSSYRTAFINPIIVEDLYDSTVMYDIDRYERNNTVSPLLKSLFDNTDKFSNLDVFVGYLKQRYDDFNYQLAYLYELELKIKKLLSEGAFDEAETMMNDEYEKRSF